MSSRSSEDGADLPGLGSSGGVLGELACSLPRAEFDGGEWSDGQEEVSV